jgi:hypothetical protein
MQSNPIYIESSCTLKMIISRDSLRQRLIYEIEDCIQRKKSRRWYTHNVHLIIQDGHILACIDSDDWIWIVRRISVLYDIPHEYSTSVLPNPFDFAAFPFLSTNEIRDFIRSRTEHNLFVLCNASQYETVSLNSLSVIESKIQTLLEKNGGLFHDISLPQPNLMVDILWKNRQNQKIYAPLFAISNSKTPKNTLLLEDLLFDSTLEPYHTLLKITKNLPFPNIHFDTTISTQSHFFVAHTTQMKTLQIFDQMLQEILSVLENQIPYVAILDWFEYHILQLPITYQMSLYESTISKTFVISDNNLYQQSIYELLLRLSKSKRLRQNRNQIHNQLCKVQCM